MSVIALASWLLQFASIPLGGDAAHAAPGAPAPDTRPPADKLFAKIYPVFVHARCANCHGVVQHYPGIIRSVTKETHPGGEVTDPLHPTAVDCGQCHDATRKIEKEWQFTAPPIMEWNGMSEEQLCVMQAAQVRFKNGEAGGAGVGLAQSYLHHVATDSLIEQAFKGRAGGARAKADPDLHNVTDPPSGVNLIWKPWAMTIHCPKAFPNNDGTMGCVGSEPHDTGAASGALHQTVKDAGDAAEPASWLYRSPMATARIDTGEGLPVHVKVIWALRLEQR